MMRNLQLENAAEAAGAALNALAEALEKETRKHSAVTVTFTPAKTMREAAAIAAERCEAWRIDGDTDGTRLGFGELRYACEEQDMQVTFPMEESWCSRTVPSASRWTAGRISSGSFCRHENMPAFFVGMFSCPSICEKHDNKYCSCPSERVL